jgi:hypothetical protein
MWMLHSLAVDALQTQDGALNSSTQPSSVMILTVTWHYLIWNCGPTRERIQVDCTYTGRFMPLVVAVTPSSPWPKRILQGCKCKKKQQQ